jgi:hypothetical protein
VQESSTVRLADFAIDHKLVFVRYLRCRLSGSNSVVECQLPVAPFIFYNLGALLSSLLSLRVLPEIVRFGWHTNGSR